ncbi:MAG: DUF483 domain-containing protein [Nanoarchaeota archaeon]|nr:DUF483 domain-containing protein [Nanoarchaeota archaeon]
MASKSIYKSKQWKKLPLYSRADLIPVIEKVRHGGQIDLATIKMKKRLLDSRRKNLEYCLGEVGLFYQEYNLDYFVAYDSLLLNRLFSGKLKTGEFLGYPECCIKHFEKSCKEYLEHQKTPPAIDYSQKARKALQEGVYDEVLDYILHIPCSISCKETIDMAYNVKTVLESNDAEVLNYLKEFNRSRIEKIIKNKKD